jgi:hypothetical protein
MRHLYKLRSVCIPHHDLPIARWTARTGVALFVLTLAQASLYFVYLDAPPPSNVLLRVLIGIVLGTGILAWFVGYSFLLRTAEPRVAPLANLLLMLGSAYVVATLVAMAIEAGTVLGRTDPDPVGAANPPGQRSEKPVYLDLPYGVPLSLEVCRGPARIAAKVALAGWARWDTILQAPARLPVQYIRCNDTLFVSRRIDKVAASVMERVKDIVADNLGVVGDVDVELLLQLHDELDRVQRVGAQVVDEGGFHRDLFFVDAQLIGHDVDHAFLD